jgi:hypothetical protein
VGAIAPNDLPIKPDRPLSIQFLDDDSVVRAVRHVQARLMKHGTGNEKRLNSGGNGNCFNLAYSFLQPYQAKVLTADFRRRVQRLDPSSPIGNWERAAGGKHSLEVRKLIFDVAVIHCRALVRSANGLMTSESERVASNRYAEKTAVHRISLIF